MENRSINEMVSELIGDTPVSVQLNAILGMMANKEEVETLKQEIIALRKEIENISGLVGDTPVSRQIYNAVGKGVR